MRNFRAAITPLAFVAFISVSVLAAVRVVRQPFSTVDRANAEQLWNHLQAADIRGQSSADQLQLANRMLAEYGVRARGFPEWPGDTQRNETLRENLNSLGKQWFLQEARTYDALPAERREEHLRSRLLALGQLLNFRRQDGNTPFGQLFGRKDRTGANSDFFQGLQATMLNQMVQAWAREGTPDEQAIKSRFALALAAQLRRAPSSEFRPGDRSERAPPRAGREDHESRGDRDASGNQPRDSSERDGRNRSRD